MRKTYFNYFFPLLLCFAFSSPGWARSGVYIAFNPEDCRSCIDAMKYIDDLRDGTNVYIVFEKKMREDSAVLSKNFLLNRFNFHYIWSDSLFKQIAIHGSISGIKFTMDDDIHGLSIPLRGLTKEVVSWFNSYTDNRADTLFIDVPYRRSAKLSSYGLSLFFINKIRSEVYVYSLTNQQARYRITLSDSVIKASYEASLGVGSYAKNMQQLKELQVPKIINIERVWQTKDSIYMVVSYSYVFIYQGQTAVNKFYVLNTYYGDEIKNISPFPMAIEKGREEYSFTPFIYKQGNGLYGSLFGTSAEPGNRKFFVKYKYDHDKIVVDSVGDQDLPVTYKNYNFSNVIYSNGYYALPLEDKIYQLTTGNPEVSSLNIFPVNNFSKDVYSLPDCYMTDFKMSSRYLWMLYRNNTMEQFFFVKYDRKANKVVFKREVEEGPGDGDPVIDAFNYNCLLFLSRNGDVIRNNFVHI